MRLSYRVPTTTWMMLRTRPWTSALVPSSVDSKWTRKASRTRFRCCVVLSVLQRHAAKCRHPGAGRDGDVSSASRAIPRLSPSPSPGWAPLGCLEASHILAASSCQDAVCGGGGRGHVRRSSNLHLLWQRFVVAGRAPPHCSICFSHEGALLLVVHDKVPRPLF